MARVHTTTTELDLAAGGRRARAADHPAPAAAAAPAAPTGPGALVLALASAAAFGLSGPLGKALLLSGWSTGAVVLTRNVVGALVLLPLTVRVLRRSRPSRRELGVLSLYGVLGVAGAQAFYFSAIERLSVGVALLLEYLAPVLLVLWSWAWTRTAPGARTLVGSATALAGMALVVDVAGDLEVDPVGVLLGLCAAGGLAAYFVIAARPTPGLPTVALAGGGLLVGSAVLGVLALVGVLPWRAGTADAQLGELALPFWVPAALLGLLGCAFAYLSGTVATSRLGERVASFVGLTEVLFAVVAAWLLLGEVPATVQVVGGALVLVGLVLVRTDRRTAGLVPSPDA